MTVYETRIIALAAVLVGISALVPIAHLHAEQPPELRPVAELRPLAEQGDADAQNDLGVRYADGRAIAQETQAEAQAEADRRHRLMPSKPLRLPIEFSEAVADLLRIKPPPKQAKAVKKRAAKKKGTAKR